MQLNTSLLQSPEMLAIIELNEQIRQQNKQLRHIMNEVVDAVSNTIRHSKGPLAQLIRKSSEQEAGEYKRVIARAMMKRWTARIISTALTS